MIFSAIANEYTTLILPPDYATIRIAQKYQGDTMHAKKTLYGNVALVRAFCPDCLCTALIIQGKYACCDRPFDFAEIDSTVERMCEPPQKRQLPPVVERRKILKDQGHRCIYCGIRFGSEYLDGGTIRTVVYEWDHFVPFSYGQNNEAGNFVAACKSCNQIKKDRIFESLDAARLYIIEAKLARR